MVSLITIRAAAVTAVDLVRGEVADPTGSLSGVRLELLSNTLTSILEGIDDYTENSLQKRVVQRETST